MDSSINSLQLRSIPFLLLQRSDLTQLLSQTLLGFLEFLFHEHPHSPLPIVISSRVLGTAGSTFGSTFGSTTGSGSFTTSATGSGFYLLWGKDIRTFSLGFGCCFALVTFPSRFIDPIMTCDSPLQVRTVRKPNPKDPGTPYCSSLSRAYKITCLWSQRTSWARDFHTPISSWGIYPFFTRICGLHEPSARYSQSNNNGKATWVGAIWTFPFSSSTRRSPILAITRPSMVWMNNDLTLPSCMIHCLKEM